MPIALAAVPSPAHFAPRADASYRYMVTQTRDDGGGIQDFTLSRMIRFRRETGGWIAIVTFGPVVRSGKVDASGMFETMMAAMSGLVLTCHLDPPGRIIRLDQPDAAWQRMIAAMRAIPGGDDARHHAVETLIAGLDQMSQDDRTALLCSAVGAVVAGADADRDPQAATPVTIPRRGTPASITGTETVRATDGFLHVETHGTGPVVIGDGIPASIRIDRDRTIDRATGLIVRSREARVTEAVIDGRPIRQSEISSAALEEAVP